MNPYWWLRLVTGILLVLLAFWVSGSDRVYALAQRTYPAFTVRHAGQEAAPSILQAHADQSVIRR